MTFRDIVQWTTMAVAAAAILPLTAASAPAAYGVPGADDTSWQTTKAQAIDRVARGSHAGGLVTAGEEEMHADDDGQAPEMDDPGTDNPPGTDDAGDVYYAAVDDGIACSPGGWHGPDGRCLSSG